MSKFLYNSGTTFEAGILMLRLGIGVMIFLHGLPKILGGPELWTKVGSSVGYFGIDFAHVFWGLMAGLAETLGGVLIFFGFLTRPAAFFVLMVMVVAAAKGFFMGGGFPVISHPVEMGITMLAIIITGPGKFSLDRKFFG